MLRGARARVLFTALSLASVSACARLVGADFSDLAPRDDGIDAATDGGAGARDANVDASDADDATAPDARDAIARDAPAGDAEAGSGCPTNDGLMVRLDAPKGSFCIDAHEVTNAQFNAYLLDPRSPFDTPPVCDGQRTADGGPLDPPSPSSAGQDDLPPSIVNFCYAWAYCRFVGKRLCGAIAQSHDSSGAPHSDGSGSLGNEWAYACANGSTGSTRWPYGDTYDPSACNTGLASAAPAPPGSKPACHGKGAGFDQIFDMSGNMAEFDDFVSTYAHTTDSANAAVQTHGGFSMSTGDDTSCVQTGGQFGAYTTYATWVGFRCCSDVR